MAQASFEPGISSSRVLRSAAAPHWLGMTTVLTRRCVEIIPPMVNTKIDSIFDKFHLFLPQRRLRNCNDIGLIFLDQKLFF